MKNQGKVQCGLDIEASRKGVEKRPDREMVFAFYRVLCEMNCSLIAMVRSMEWPEWVKGLLAVLSHLIPKGLLYARYFSST